jgi:carbohydrate-binding DOMON domain-containing protein
LRRFPRFLLPTLAVAVQSLGGASAVAAPLFAFEDPRGDDNGSGVLIYPNRDDLQPGDLDLYRFSAEQKSDGVWFTVEMAQPVRSPVGRVTELGQTPVDRLARHGFYTFNVDVYIDTDRIAGSGRTEAIPGRRVAIDRGYAWERCIVLTPRPDVARTMLQMSLDEQFEAELRADQG